MMDQFIITSALTVLIGILIAVQRMDERQKRVHGAMLASIEAMHKIVEIHQQDIGGIAKAVNVQADALAELERKLKNGEML